MIPTIIIPTIIIPAYNAEKTIIEVLESLELQTHRNFSTIIVDDGSTDKTYDLIGNYIKNSDLDITLIQIENAGPAHARNLGASHSKSDLIVFSDSDCVLPANWLEEMLKPIGGDVVGVTCGYKVKNSESLVARYIDYEIARRHEKLAGMFVDTIGTYSACYRKDAFEEVGGFNTDYKNASGEDFDLSFKMRRHGYKLKFVDSTFVYHYHPDTFKKYLKQQFYRGYWRVEMYLKNKEKIVSKESYSGLEAQYQFILVNLVLLSLVMLPFNTFLPIVPIVALIASNIPFGVWCYKREHKFLILAPLIASIRSVAGTLGVYFYIVNRILNALRR